MPELTPPADAVPIEVNGRRINPNEHYARDAQNTDHIIVTVKDILKLSQRTEMKDLGVEFLEDLGENNLLCRYRPTDLQPLRRLDYVKQVDVYRNIFKIPEALLDLIERKENNVDGTGNMLCTVDIMVHSEVSDMNALAESIAGKLRIERDRLEIIDNRIRLETEVGNLTTIASDDRVRILEYVLPPTLDDAQATQVIGAPVKLNTSTFRGQDQVIGVVDTGFDLGSAQDCHPAFAGRISNLISIGRQSASALSDARKVDDPQGHGTHVCGTIVAQDIDTDAGSVGGVAPDAKLVVTSFITEDNRTPVKIKDTKSLFETPYTESDAKLYSNSWGDDLLSGNKQCPYTQAAADIDIWVRDKVDAVVCFSAGNNNQYIANDTKQAIGSQAAAKNCITVGASGSTRIATDFYSQKPISIDPDHMSDDSSQGPTANNRIKPDVVAPGVNIFSAHSRSPFVTYKAATASSSPTTLYPGVLWKVRTGTSHSTPLVAGCAAVLRQILQSVGCMGPPAALIKAVIINGADKLPNVDTSAQGFGRVNLEASARMLEHPPILVENTTLSSSPSGGGGTLIGPLLKQDEEFSFTLLPQPAPSPATDLLPEQPQLKITMVYNDLPGKQIQNNLNLTIIDPQTGEIKHGGLSEDDIDLQNNVEQVVWSPAPQTPMTIRVKAQKIFPDSQQDFALAWSTAMPYKGFNQ